MGTRGAALGILEFSFGRDQLSPFISMLFGIKEIFWSVC